MPWFYLGNGQQNGVGNEALPTEDYGMMDVMLPPSEDHVIE